jgi:UDP-glucose 4-epimerase
MVLPRFVQAALRDEPIMIYGDGKQTRCFCHVTDVVRALVALPKQPQAIGQIYNLGSTEEVSILELAQRVKQVTQSPSALQFIPYDEAYAKGFEDMRRRVPSLDKIEQLMGWRPTQSLDDILRLTIEYQRVLQPAN